MTSTPSRHGIVLVAEQLVDNADLRAGWRVLDVQTGSGNAAIAAARLGCEVVGIDYVPSLVEARAWSGRSPRGSPCSCWRATRSRSCSLTRPSTPSRPCSARCLRRTTGRQRGRSFASPGRAARSPWRADPDGFIGQLLRTVAGHVTPPAGVASPMLWGTDAHLRDLFGDAIVSLETTERTFTFRYRSAQEFVDFFRTWYGPTLKAFAALDGDEARAALEADLVSLATRFDRLEARKQSRSLRPTRRRSPSGVDRAERDGDGRGTVTGPASRGATRSGTKPTATSGRVGTKLGRRSRHDAGAKVGTKLARSRMNPAQISDSVSVGHRGCPWGSRGPV